MTRASGHKQLFILILVLSATRLDATTVVVVSTGSDILLAADSRRRFIDRAGTETACNMVVKKDAAYALTGVVGFAGESNDFARLTKVAKNNLRETIGAIGPAMTSLIASALPRIENSRKVNYVGNPVVTVVGVGSDMKIYTLEFLLETVDKVSIRSTQRTGGRYVNIFTTESGLEGASSYLQLKPADWFFQKPASVARVTEFVKSAINADPTMGGLPLSISRVTTNSTEWVERGGCQTSQLDTR